MKHRSRAARIATLVGLLAAVVLPAGAADAAAYRYWGYYTWDGKAWQFATKGPDQLVPADGAVEGWRFAVGEESVTRFPRTTDIDFDAICGGTEAADDKKRVAVLLDFGREADTADGSTPPEPEARCASVPTDASALDVLGAVADVRTDKALVCGIDGHPATSCGEEVKTVTAEAQAADEPVAFATPDAAADAGDEADAADDDNGFAVWLGLAIVVLVALAVGFTAMRRRRSA